jgi:hypothetical protein
LCAEVRIPLSLAVVKVPARKSQRPAKSWPVTSVVTHAKYQAPAATWPLDMPSPRPSLPK